MIDTLHHLLSVYVEWRSAVPEVYLSLGPIAGAAIAAGVPFVLNELFGGPSSQEKQAFANQSAVSQAEADRIRKQIEILNRLVEISKTPSAMSGILEATGGQGFQLPNNLAEARQGQDLSGLLGAIDFDAQNERDLLLQILGIPTGTGATQQGANLAFARQGQQESAFGDIAQLLAQLLSSNSRSRGTASVTPAPVNFGGSVTGALSPFSIDLGG